MTFSLFTAALFPDSIKLIFPARNLTPTTPYLETKRRDRELTQTTDNRLSLQETPLNMSLEHLTMPSRNPSTTADTPAIHPSTTPTAPALEKEQQPLTISAPPTITITTAGEARTNAGTNPNTKYPLSPVERDYDPTRDDRPIDELLARPRLSRSPAESFHKAALNGRTMKPLRYAGGDASRTEDFEAAKERLRTVSVEVGRMVLPKE
jgi:hypothetical protein